MGIIKDNDYIYLYKEQDKKEKIVLNKDDSFIYFKY